MPPEPAGCAALYLQQDGAANREPPPPQKNRNTARHARTNLKNETALTVLLPGARFRAPVAPDPLLAATAALGWSS